MLRPIGCSSQLGLGHAQGLRVGLWYQPLDQRPATATSQCDLEERLKSEAIGNIEAFLLVPGKNALFPSFKKVSWFDDGELP
jgi:hypothetical protein